MALEKVLVVVLAASLFVDAVVAQIGSPTGNVYGTVFDAQEAPFTGLPVTLSGPDAARATTTNPRGDFRFLAVAPGSYMLVLESPGFRILSREVTVQPGRNAVLHLTMQLADAREEITVQGDDTGRDSRKVETGATFDERELRELPTTRDLYGFLRQVPGVLLADMNVGNGYSLFPIGFVGKGAHEQQNTFYLDGTAVSLDGFSPNLYDFDSLDSLSVATGGSDPSLATPGVAINVVTKRGTNELAGSGRALYTDGSQWNYGLEVGGVLRKDRLWLWGAGASTSFLGQTFHLPGGEPSRSQETHRYWNGKLSALPIPANSLTLAYTSYARLVDGRGASRTRSEASTQTIDFAGAAYKAEDSQVLSESLFATAIFSYVPNHRDAVPEGGLNAQALEDARRVWRNGYTVERAERTQHQAGLTVSSFFATATLRHELKLGFGYRHAYNQSATAWTGDQLLGLAADRPPLASVTRGTIVKPLVNFYDAYLSDTIQAGNLTVNLGVRFDYQQSRNLPSSVRANDAFPDLLPAVSYPGDTGYPLTWRSVEPRIGATWAIDSDRKTLLRASYAGFANQMGLEITHISAFPGIAELLYYWTDSDQDGRVDPSEVDTSSLVLPLNVDPDHPGSIAPVNRIAPDLAPPQTDELIVGVERQIFSDVYASLAYTHRRLRGPLFSPLIDTTRSSYRYLGNASGSITDSNTGFTLDFSEPYYGLITEPPTSGSVLQNRPDATETYDGVELQLQKTFSNGWMLRASGAWNDWRQQIGAGGVVDPNNVTPGVNASGPLVEGNINAAWQFNVAGTVVLPLTIQAGVNLFGRQGFPILYAVEAVTRGAQQSPILQIGSATDYRTPNVYQLDVQFSRDFVIGGRVTVTPTIACFNLLDSRTVLAREGFVGWYDTEDPEAFRPNTDLFNVVVSELGPRTIRGGVRISF